MPKNEFELGTSVFKLAMRDKVTSSALAQLDENNSYHNYKRWPSKHTYRVVGAVERLARIGGMNESQIDILKVSAVYHDVCAPGVGHEKNSAEFAIERLSFMHVPEEICQMVYCNILVTEGQFNNGAYVTNPEDKMQRIMCDADMVAVSESTALFWQINMALMEEVKMKKESEVSTVEMKGWYESQVNFLAGLAWKTDEAYLLWEISRIANQENMESWVRALESDG